MKCRYCDGPTGNATDICNGCRGGSARARSTDPSTSHAAATSVGGGDLSENQQAVMTVLRMRNFPMLDEQLVASYKTYQKPMKLPKQSESGIRSRRAELSKRGLLVEGEKRRMSTGRQGRTWSVPPEGD